MGLIPLVTSMPVSLRYPRDTIILTHKGNFTLATLKPESARLSHSPLAPKGKDFFSEPDPEGGVVVRFSPK